MIQTTECLEAKLPSDVGAPSDIQFNKMLHVPTHFAAEVVIHPAAECNSEPGDQRVTGREIDRHHNGTEVELKEIRCLLLLGFCILLLRTSVPGPWVTLYEFHRLHGSR